MSGLRSAPLLVQVHAIGIFDIRTFNMDRNSDNLLVRRGSGDTGGTRLVPIDHGYILPSYCHLEVSARDCNFRSCALKLIEDNLNEGV